MYLPDPEHQKLCSLADDIVDLVSNIAFTSEAELASKRLAFCKLLNTHSAAELNGLRAIPTETRARHGQALKAYEEGARDWRQRLAECNRLWSSARIAAEPSGFLAHFRPLVQEMRTRMQWEEHHLYPEILGRSSMRARMPVMV